TGSGSIEGRITNGYPAYEGKVPYIVGLGFSSSGGGWWCGGSIIGNTWVVTAAHCTHGAESVTIYYGALWRLQAQYTHTVGSGSFRQHAHYNTNNLNNDISLINTPHVDFWHLVNKVDLPSSNDRYNSYDGWWALASGWGRPCDNCGVSDYLNCVDSQIISRDACAGVYGSDVVNDNVLCTSTPDGKSTCSGDSGGPLVLHDGGKLVGVTSFVASSGCTSGLPDGFTRHCIGDAGSVTVYFGATWRTNAQFTHTVGNGNFIKHSNADIALIRIPHVDFWHMVNKVELPSYNDRYNNYNEWWAVACGWGGTYDGSPLPDWLQCVDLQIVHNDECNWTYGSVGDNTICTRTVDGKSICGGDSGGPLVTHDGNKLVGVSNFVSSNGCQSGAPAGFQRVTYHLDWIRDHTGI
ncbi:hypothetical protein KR200_012081, partial [Drosophila serrata]